MSDGFDRLSGSTGLPVGVSRELRKFFQLANDPEFIRQHNERMLRRWESTNPDHIQAVYALFDVRVGDDLLTGAHYKHYGDEVLHHQFYFQAEKELEYWALNHLGEKVSAAFYVRSYATGEWHYIERKTISLSTEKTK